MIWGHDRSAQLLVNSVILFFVLSAHFIGRYIKQKKQQNKDEINENQTED